MTAAEQLAAIRECLRPVLGDVPCPECVGTGAVVVHYGSHGSPPEQESCDQCSGRGTIAAVNVPGVSVLELVQRAVEKLQNKAADFNSEATRHARAKCKQEARADAAENAVRELVEALWPFVKPLRNA